METEPNLNEKIEKSNILVVGAGGIGCELLKNLVLTGFKNIVIVDFDTIDVSNLNRQFLFQRQHVGKSKAEVATSAALKLRPDAKIEFHHRSITDQQFDVNFFKRFDFVMNALDNRAARNHVNRLCLAADVPLIESGSAGYLGQVTVIRKGITECYECQPKAPQKTFPGCTIRNTPSEPIHCIVWAKHLFNQLFGEADPDEDVSPDVEDPELEGGNVVDEQARGDVTNGGGVPKDPKPSTESFQHRISTRKWALDNEYDPKILFEKLFVDDINYLLSMDKLWKKRTPPKPLHFDSLTEEEMSDTSTTDKTETITDQLIWSPKKCRDVFTDCVTKLKKRLDVKEGGEVLIWDKDDDDCMDFVTSCANLRCTIFSIPNKSRFDTKSMAGNIIAAIATTNAIIAGLIVMEALKILSGQFSSCCTTYLTRKPNFRGRLFVGTSLCPPNPKCYVCSSKQEVAVKLDTTKFTVKSLEDKILKQFLHMVAPDVEIDDNKGTIIISSEEGETDGLSSKFLNDLKVVDGTRLICDDFKQQFVLTLIIVQSSDLGKDVEFEVLTDTSQLKASQEPAASAETAEDDDEPVCFIESPCDASLKKRKLDESEEIETSLKRARKP